MKARHISIHDHKAFILLGLHNTALNLTRITGLDGQVKQTNKN